MTRTGRVGLVTVGLVLAVALLGACTPAESEPAVAPPTTTGAGSATSAASPSSSEVTTTTAYAPPPLPAASTPVAAPASDARLLVLGDSVILGAQQSVTGALAGWRVTFDAQESRLIDQGLVVLRTRKADADKAAGEAHEQAVALAQLSGQPAPPAPKPVTYRELLGPVVVISLCTNYSAGNGFATFIDQYMAELSSVDRVVWVTCGEWSPGQTEANAAIRDAAARHPRLVVADWAPYGRYPPYTYDDGIHLNEQGRPVMGDLVSRAVGPAPSS